MYGQEISFNKDYEYVGSEKVTRLLAGVGEDILGSDVSLKDEDEESNNNEDEEKEVRSEPIFSEKLQLRQEETQEEED
ncbi:hypothetical protein RIF29_29843 [Crotalaria pallida]|uniref:Uncharacterized protein n=1 Tax=Crotalaria pallida TaxID=3830 RepID=A0AAN9EG58_CROPI